MITILSIGIFQAVFMSIIVLSKKEKKRTDIFLVSWLLTLSLHFLYYIFSLNNIISPIHIIAIIGTGFPLLYGPFLHFYIKNYISNIEHPIWWYLLHLSPFLIWGVYFNALNYADLTFNVSAINGDLTFSKSTPNYILLTTYPLALSGGGYTLWNLWLLKKFRSKLKENYSEIETINLKWVDHWAYLSFLSFVVIFILDFADVNPFLFKLIIVLMMTVIICYIGYFGYKQTNIFFNYPIIQNKRQEPEKGSMFEKSKYVKSGILAEEIDSIANRLDKHMISNKPWLNDSLSLQQLAEEMNLSRQNLSQIINENYGKNFYEFINHYRVEETKRLLKNPKYKYLTITAIAFEAGFKTKSTFYKFFKEYTGLTPSEYLKKTS